MTTRPYGGCLDTAVFKRRSDFYCGLQTTQATEQFGKLIRQQIKFDAIT